MSEITVRQALQQGLSEAIENDPDVFIMGEDIRCLFTIGEDLN